jgi:hypothetical protein
METVYLVCALAGGTLLVAQFVLSLFGLGDHHDVSVDHHDFGGHHHDIAHEHASSWFVGILTFRSVVAALTFFGLVGLAVGPHLGDDLLTAGAAVAAGAGALLAVAWIMKALWRLRAEGTARIERAVGQNGTVYLTVPAHKAGVGKVTLTLQNRTIEYQAITAHEQLPTGAKVVVVSVVSPDTVEVASVIPSSEERTAHV